MISVVVGWLGNLLGGPFAKAALDAYRAKLAAGNTSERITADLAARELIVEKRERELATQILIGEQGRWYTLFAKPTFCFRICHICVESRGLGQGSRSRSRCDGGASRRDGSVGDDLLTAYFGGRSIEKVARILIRK
jgi:hypothetical protein